MSSTNLTWEADGLVDSYKVYRSTTTMNLESLPAPIATGITEKSYSDTTVLSGMTYYYRVASVKNSIEKISSEISVIAAQTLDAFITALFANGEQGVAYDPTDINTLYQDFESTTQVSGFSQPVGMMLDKSKKMALGPELMVNGTFDSNLGWSMGSGWSISSGSGIANSAPSNSNLVPVDFVSLEVGRWYEAKVSCTSYTSGSAVLFAFDGSINVAGSKSIRAVGDYIFRFKAASTSIKIYLTVEFGYTLTASFDNVKLRKIAGEHAIQSNSSMRPLYVNTPKRLDFDTIDDKLITIFPAELTECTVIRAVPNVGVQILMNQTIPTQYNDSTDHCGLIVVNRALTASEINSITSIYNTISGV